jgi:hypothetical protein
LRKKLIDAARRLSKSALSLQVRASRRDPIALRIENRDPITVVAFVVKCKLVSVITMCAGCHRDGHLRAEHQVGLGEGTIFQNENWGCVKVIRQQVLAMSALPPKADIVQRDRDVRFVPKADKAESQ